MRRGDVAILGRIALEVGPAETVAILGPSGIGKTTLLRIVAGLERPEAGGVEGAGRVAMVFQEPTLLPWRTVRQNIAIPTGCDPDEADRLIAETGLAGRADAYPRALSLGQQRRVALARAFAARPETLLLDEPFVSLDAEAAEGMQRLLARLIEARRPRTLLVTHAPEEALRLADRIVQLAGSPAGIAAVTRIARPRAARSPDWTSASARAWAAGAVPETIA
jgi:NitT/TauT family transport system ATP-binding protein